MDVSKIEVPQNGWFIMENPIKMIFCVFPIFWVQHPYQLVIAGFQPSTHWPTGLLQVLPCYPIQHPIKTKKRSQGASTPRLFPYHPCTPWTPKTHGKIYIFFSTLEIWMKLTTKNEGNVGSHGFWYIYTDMEW